VDTTRERKLQIAPHYDRVTASRASRAWSRGIAGRIWAIVVGAFGVVALIPFIWMISTSLKLHGHEFDYPPQWIPTPIEWINYPQGLTTLPFALYFENTVIITVASTVGAVLSASFVAFGFARLRFPERDFLFALLISTLMLPSIVTLIPTFVLFKTLGWVNTFLPLIVPHFFGSAFYIFLMRQFYQTIPYELDEAARIDGAGSVAIWWRLLVPLSGSALATVAIFTALGSWNDFLGPLIYLSKPSLRTVALALQFFLGQYGTQWNQLMAVSVVMTIPVLILFFVAQRYFIQGIVMTGMGGR
jgi:ABC-type glycerol-3-phosphate transport system permease component